MKRSLPNGPLRVQSKEFIKEVCKISDWILIYNSEYSVTWRHTSVAGDMIVSRKVHGKFHESRWHRGIYFSIFVLDDSIEDYAIVEDFFMQ